MGSQYKPSPSHGFIASTGHGYRVLLTGESGLCHSHSSRFLGLTDIHRVGYPADGGAYTCMLNLQSAGIGSGRPLHQNRAVFAVNLPYWEHCIQGTDARSPLRYCR